MDTSVLVDFLKNRNNKATNGFNTVLELNIPFGITGHIYQEPLQGASSEKDYHILKCTLIHLHFMV